MLYVVSNFFLLKVSYDFEFFFFPNSICSRFLSTFYLFNVYVFCFEPEKQKCDY